MSVNGPSNFIFHVDSQQSKKTPCDNIFYVDPHLYGRILGEFRHASLILRSLSLDKEKIPRFRDAYVYNGEIVILTRTGSESTNLDQWFTAMTYLSDHASFIRTADCSCHTYARWFFNCPDGINFKIWCPSEKDRFDEFIEGANNPSDHEHKFKDVIEFAQSLKPGTTAAILDKY